MMMIIDDDDNDDGNDAAAADDDVDCNDDDDDLGKQHADVDTERTLRSNFHRKTVQVTGNVNKSCCVLQYNTAMFCVCTEVSGCDLLYSSAIFII